MSYGIPTKYGFINFRSRLEARWAAFFDLCGWAWTYEPFDLPGWIPDFEIVGPSGSVLVEIKPISYEWQLYALSQEIIPSLPKGGEHRVLLLGTSPLWNEQPSDDGVILGGLVEPSENKDQPPQYGDRQIMRRGTPEHPIDFCDDTFSYAGKLTGQYEGGHIDHIPVEQARRLWAEACNLTQWRAVTPR